MSKKIYIPGRMQNAAVDEEGNRLPVAGAEDIDAGEGKNQQQVNKDVDDALTLHQQEINALDSQNYVTVTAYSSLPATGAVNTIYRVSSYDDTQVDATKYAEYAWNGRTYVLLDVKTQVGEVFDISQYKAVGGTLATFDNLADALDSGNNVPSGLRKGGMSVKFVQSSDNKYVQFRCKSQSFSINPDDWAFEGDITLVENPEYIDAKIDKYGKLFEGIRHDGTKEIVGDLQVGGKIINPPLQHKLNSKQNKEAGKSLIQSEIAESMYTKETPEYIKAETDSNGKFLFGIGSDGSIEWVKGIPTPIRLAINASIDKVKTNYKNDFNISNGGYAVKDSIKKQLFVDCKGHGHPYLTIQQAINAVKNPSITNQYEIVVFPGTYYENRLLVPPYTHIHGLRANSVTVTSFNDKDVNNYPVFDQAYGSSKLSNMTIKSYTGYCIHFDSHQELAMAALVNENLTLIKCYNQTGMTNSIIGGGSFKYGTLYHWKSCIFIGDNSASPNNVDVGVHTNKDAFAENTHIKFENCRFVNCNLAMLSVGGFGHCVCEILNCTYDKGKEGLYTPFSWLRTVDMPYTFTANTIEWQFIGGGNKNFAPLVGSFGYGLCVESNSAIDGEEIFVYGAAADDYIFGQITYQKGGVRVKASAIGSYMVKTNVSRGTGASDCFLLHNRLGDMTSNPKVLNVRVKSSSSDHVYTYTFNKDYSNMTDEAIIAEINEVLVGCTLSMKAPKGWDTFNLREVRQITCTDTNDILYGTWVTEDGKTCTSSTPVDKIFGIALQDAVNGQPLRVWTGDGVHYEGGNLRDGEWGICDYINYHVDYPGSDTNFGNISQSATNKFGKMVGGKFYRY